MLLDFVHGGWLPPTPQKARALILGLWRLKMSLPLHSIGEGGPRATQVPKEVKETPPPLSSKAAWHTGLWVRRCCRSHFRNHDLPPWCSSRPPAWAVHSTGSPLRKPAESVLTRLFFIAAFGHRRCKLRSEGSQNSSDQGDRV